ncbi:MAG: hypothetical protein EBV53_06095, partial [Proteobacteria bacterium]|nr:hypothetical protein [Pseudomonadota bacterium]
GRAKLEVGVARGKKQYDKRATSIEASRKACHISFPPEVSTRITVPSGRETAVLPHRRDGSPVLPVPRKVTFTALITGLFGYP